LSAIEEATRLLQHIEKRRKTHRIEYYDPYSFQKAFHHARRKKKGASIPSDPQGVLATQRALMAANQVGKTFCGAMEMAYHLTGQYPDWWEGHIFKFPIRALVGSNTNETVRDLGQSELFGDCKDPDAIGTGTIPIDCIGEKYRKPGVMNAYESCLVKHRTGGWSKVSFRAYEQGAKKHMGLKFEVLWPDEEPPAEIWSQYLRAVFSTNGILMLTFTPEDGVTEVVHGFVNDLKDTQALIEATWDDAPHMTKERQAEHLKTIPKHEQEMRTKGVPKMGSGLVFPVLDEDIMVNDIEIPYHWPRVNGVDFGWDHPFAGVAIAWDRDTDTVYVYNEYREERALMAVHADAINRWGQWIPIVWPHDGMMRDKQSGKPLASLYRDDYHMNMWMDCFSNPPSPGQDEGQGGQGVEVGVMEMLNRMETGRFKVFSTCKSWFEEKRMYHRKDGQIVKLRDDLMSATRYAVQSLRFAIIQPRIRQKPKHVAGLSNW